LHELHSSTEAAALERKKFLAQTAHIRGPTLRGCVCFRKLQQVSFAALTCARRRATHRILASATALALFDVQCTGRRVVSPGSCNTPTHLSICKEWSTNEIVLMSRGGESTCSIRQTPDVLDVLPASQKWPGEHGPVHSIAVWPRVAPYRPAALFNTGHKCEARTLGF
jgi:hypothetical protein